MLIPETSNIFLYGKGVFTTVGIIRGNAFLWKKHWDRLTVSASTLEIDLAEFNEQLVFQKLIDKIREDHISNGRSRITFADASSGTIWPSAEADVNKTRLIITTADLRPVSDNFKLTVSPYPVNSCSPLAGIKSCNYLEKILALDEAKARGFDEAIQLNERGEVSSATMANVFWLRDDQLYTPGLKTGCLAGTTREFVLENMDCRETAASIDELRKADSIFLSSAGLGVVQVAEFESRQLKQTDHPIFDLLPKSI